MKTFRINTIIACLISLFFIISCTKDKDNADDQDGDDDITNSDGTVGIWQRYGSPNGYNTDLAIGNIPGEPTNRVYMCEHPGSPSAGLYKGYINGNTISWDAVHGLPNADFNKIVDGRSLYFGVGAVSDAGKYRKGVWTNTCGELKYSPKRIFYRWTQSSSCSGFNYNLSFNYPDLASTLVKNQYYGPIAAGTIEVTLYYNGDSYQYSVMLEDPPAGYKRLYTDSAMVFDTGVNRCVFSIGLQLVYIDQLL